MTAYFPEFTIGGQAYDFPHVEQVTFTITSHLAKRDLRGHVTFSNYCLPVATIRRPIQRASR